MPPVTPGREGTGKKPLLEADSIKKSCDTALDDVIFLFIHEFEQLFHERGSY